MDLFLLAGTNWAKTINLVKKDDAWLPGLGLFKQQAQLSFSLTHPLAQTVGSLSHEKGHLLSLGRATGRQCASQ